MTWLFQPILFSSPLVRVRACLIPSNLPHQQDANFCMNYLVSRVPYPILPHGQTEPCPATSQSRHATLRQTPRQEAAINSAQTFVMLLISTLRALTRRVRVYSQAARHFASLHSGKAYSSKQASEFTFPPSCKLPDGNCAVRHQGPEPTQDTRLVRRRARR